MKNYLILHYLNGETKTIEWGFLPEIWEEPQYDAELNDVMTYDQRIFYAHSRERRFNKMIGHYYEEPSPKKAPDKDGSKKKDGDSEELAVSGE